jgi:hypothetical protein
MAWMWYDVFVVIVVAVVSSSTIDTKAIIVTAFHLVLSHIFLNFSCRYCWVTGLTFRLGRWMLLHTAV